MKHRAHAGTAIAAASFLTVASALTALPALADDYTGVVVHVSADNIKVENMRTHETRSFIVTPNFGKVFESDGKTVYQRHLHPGDRVRIVYDEHALGMRHADRIIYLGG